MGKETPPAHAAGHPVRCCMRGLSVLGVTLSNAWGGEQSTRVSAGAPKPTRGGACAPPSKSNGEEFSAQGLVAAPKPPVVAVD